MRAQSNATLTPASEVSSRQVAAAISAAVFGWSLDLFDLFIILYVAPTIAPLFFSTKSPTLSLASVYAAFAVTLLMRPVGSALFGAYADKHGRKRAMVIAVFSVGLATALMGAVPTINQIGLAAPIIFLILRLVQGTFVGGVIASTHTIGTETVPSHWRGMLSGVIGAGGAGLGGLMASGVFYLVSSVFTGPSFQTWGWRVMFFSGILSSVLGVFIFRSLEESPLWTKLKQQGARVEKAPVRALCSSQYRWTVVANLAIVIGGATQYYLTSGYLPTFLAVINHLPKPAIGSVLLLSNLLIVITAPLAGHLSELIGRRSLFLVMGVVNLILLPLLYMTISDLGADRVGEITCLVLAITTLGNASFAPVLIFLNERFPTSIRATGTAVCWNVGFAVGGITPTFVTGLARGLAGIPHSLLLILFGAIVVYLVGGLVVPETRGRFE
jgi:MHS family proline/betaine transporter-like MFS transporter